MELDQKHSETESMVEATQKEFKLLEGLEPAEDGFKSNLLEKLESLESTMNELKVSISDEQKSRTEAIEELKESISKQEERLA